MTDDNGTRGTNMSPGTILSLTTPPNKLSINRAWSRTRGRRAKRALPRVNVHYATATTQLAKLLVVPFSDACNRTSLPVAYSSIRTSWVPSDKAPTGTASLRTVCHRTWSTGLPDKSCRCRDNPACCKMNNAWWGPNTHLRCTSWSRQ